MRLTKTGQFGWLIGLLEGEGTFWQRRQGNRPHPVIELQMTDEDVVRRAHAVAAVGNVHPGAKIRESRKQVWIWRVTRYEDAVHLLRAFFPHFGARRQARISELLDVALKHPPRRLRTRCKRGHDLSNARITVDKDGRRHRSCKQCNNLRQRLRYVTDAKELRARERERYRQRAEAEGRIVRPYRRAR